MPPDSTLSSYFSRFACGQSLRDLNSYPHNLIGPFVGQGNFFGSITPPSNTRGGEGNLLLLEIGHHSCTSFFCLHTHVPSFPSPVLPLDCFFVVFLIARFPFFLRDLPNDPLRKFFTTLQIGSYRCLDFAFHREPIGRASDRIL